MEAPFGTTGARTNTFSGATTGDGVWSGGIFGPTTDDDSATTEVDEAESGYPSGVAGEFTGHFDNGHVLGAFGATKAK